jgi:hypothetical protein
MARESLQRCKCNGVAPPESLVRGTGSVQTGRQSGVTRGSRSIGPAVERVCPTDKWEGSHHEMGMNWDSKLGRALFVATVVASTMLAAIANPGWG